MKKGQVYEGIVEKIEFPNKGIVIVEDGEKNGKCVVILECNTFHEGLLEKRFVSLIILHYRIMPIFLFLKLVLYLLH